MTDTTARQPPIASSPPKLESSATQQNVAINISGIGRLACLGRSKPIRPHHPDAIEIFGVNRAIFVSNFPVDSHVGEFGRVFSGFPAATADRPEQDSPAASTVILHGLLIATALVASGLHGRLKDCAGDGNCRRPTIRSSGDRCSCLLVAFETAVALPCRESGVLP